MNVGMPGVLVHGWLLLIHQLPAKPAYLRVKIWRRLQGIGAIAVKNAVHALPMNEESQEDFEWLLREIVEGGGEAFVCEARLIDGLSDEEVRALFDRARDADYEDDRRVTHALVAKLVALGRENPRPPPSFAVRSRACASASPRWLRSIFSAPSAAKRRKACSAKLECRTQRGRRP